VIYVCIPAHNEERTIGVLLWKIRQVLADFPRDYQLLVANDGSTDSTADVLAPYQRVLPLTVINTPDRRGYATALELLLREAVRRAEYPKRDVIVTMQADFTDDPNEIAALLKRVEAGADVVCANAELPQTAPRPQRWIRRVGNFLVRRRGWPEGVSDPLSGYRAYRVLVVKRALEERNGGRLLTWEGWSASAELLKLVQPHSRRTESIITTQRIDRQQRPSRRGFWEALPGLLGFARGGPGPLAASTLEVADATSDQRSRRRRGGRPEERQPVPRAAQQTEEPRRRRQRGEGEGQSRPEGRERGRPEKRSRPEPAEGRQRGPRGRIEQKESAATEQPERTERPRRERRPPRKRQPAEPQANIPAEPPVVGDGSEVVVASGENGQPEPTKKKRRRRRRRPRGAEASAQSGTPETTESGPETDLSVADVTERVPDEVLDAALVVPGNGTRKRRSRRGRGRRGRRANAANAETQNTGGEVAQSAPEAPPPPAINENGANAIEA
jgi:hypothetical protein